MSSRAGSGRASAWWLLLALLALLALPSAFAQLEGCAVVPGASEFAIEDLGRVVFEELRTDRAADSVRFGGGVCLEVAGERIVIRAESLELEGIDGRPRVTGEGAEVRSGAWLLGAQRLHASAEGLRLEVATLTGEGLVGLADWLELRVADGLLTGAGLVIATPSLRLDLGEGSFDGRLLSGRGVVLSTCDCPPSQAGIRLEGEAASYALDEAELRLERGALLVDGLRLPLPAHLTLSEAALEQVRLPLSLLRDERRGWLLVLPERVEQGVRLAADLAFTDLEPPRLRATIAAADEQASLALSLTSGGIELRTRAVRPLADGLILTLSQRLSAGQDEPLQDAVIALSYGPDQSLTALPAGARAGRVETALALTAQRLDGVERASARALVALRLDVAGPQSELGLVRARLEGGASGYAALPAAQQWWGVTPRWDLRRPRLSVSLTHAYRGVSGRSPFDTEVDRVEPRQLTSVLLVARGLEDAWRLDLDARYSWLPDRLRPGRRNGIQRLRLVARTAPEALGDAGVTLAWSGTIELAGWLDPRAERDAFVRLGVQARWPDAAPELGLGATLGLVPGAVGIRDLTLAVGGPLRWPEQGIELRPYLAYDVWPALRGSGWPILRAHGLALVWAGRYGTLDVAYRSESDGSVTSSLAFRVAVREPSLEDLLR